MTDKYTSGDYQRAVGQFVGREVIYCASTLVYELSQKAEHFPDYEEDIYSAWQTDPDYEEALFQNGCEQFTDEFGASCWRDNRDEMTWAGTAAESCEAFEIDADDYRREVFEHWIITDYLADRLEERGERVLRDFFGMTIWCRTTTGQSILLDHVICEIYDEAQRAN